MTSLRPQFFDFDDSLQQVRLIVDYQEQSFAIGDIVPVSRYFMVKPLEGYRVNVIGYTNKGLRSETGVPVYRHSIMPKYSIDNAAKLYRVEFYQGKKYCGMILVNYSQKT